MLLKLVLLGIAFYYAYKVFVKPLFLPRDRDKSPSRYQEPAEDEYLEYEEVD